MRRMRIKKEGKAELTSRKHIHYSITKGPQFALEVKQLETDLTVEMLASYVTSLPSSIPRATKHLSLFDNKAILRQDPSPFISLRLSLSSARNGSELIRSGAWKDASFKNYNFAAAGQLPEGGALHPLLKMREEMRQIFFDMGYVSLLLYLYLIWPTFVGFPSSLSRKPRGRRIVREEG